MGLCISFSSMIWVRMSCQQSAIFFSNLANTSHIMSFLAKRFKRILKVLRPKQVPYARHYNPRFVFLLPHFSLRFILQSGLYCRAVSIFVIFFSCNQVSTKKIEQVSTTYTKQGPLNKTSSNNSYFLALSAEKELLLLLLLLCGTYSQNWRTKSSLLFVARSSNVHKQQYLVKFFLFNRFTASILRVGTAQQDKKS